MGMLCHIQMIPYDDKSSHVSREEGQEVHIVMSRTFLKQTKEYLWNMRVSQFIQIEKDDCNSC